MKLKHLFLAGLQQIGLYFGENHSFTSRIPVELCLLVEIGRVTFLRSPSILLQLKSIRGVDVWRLWQMKALHSSSVNHGECRDPIAHSQTCISSLASIGRI